MKCLIAEDDPVSSTVLKVMVSRHATCDVVVNGQEAVDLFLQAHESNNPYDLILMDIMMPEINGLQSVLTIREKEASMNIPLGLRV
ncbi:MAG: response regulator, partial [Verrucomicrobia bacterium]|nr:response regulator [Deltaproteobacteria bacterium]